MIELRRILVPTDFSETSAAALRFGVELARRFTARLYLLHVPDRSGDAAGAATRLVSLKRCRTPHTTNSDSS